MKCRFLRAGRRLNLGVAVGIYRFSGELVELRYYAGLSLDRAADAIGISAATAYRRWAFARV